MNYTDSSRPQDRISDTCAAAAMLSMGIRLDPESPWLQLTEGREALTFFFEDSSPDGQFLTSELLKGWDDAEWHRANLRHPMAYLRVFFRNRHRYLDARHGRGQVQLAAVWREGKMQLMTVERPNYVPRSEPLPKLPDGVPIVETDNEDLSAALCAVGVPLDTARPWRFEGRRVVFRHHAVSACGQCRTAELVLAWDSPDWWQRHRRHPFAYLIVAAGNHAWLVNVTKSRPPVVVMKRGEQLGMLSAGASDAEQQQFFREWKKR